MRARPVVDLHIHYLPPALLNVFLARTRPPRAERQDGWLVLDFGDGYTERIDARLTDPGHLLETLHRTGIDLALLSINQPGVLRLEPPEAKAVAREANDELAELVGANRGVLEGLATLPWQATDAAVEELGRAAARRRPAPWTSGRPGPAPTRRRPGRDSGHLPGLVPSGPRRR